MGQVAPLGVAASGLPNRGDQANAVLSGVLSAVGPTQPFAFRGPMNIALWAQVTTSLEVTAGSLDATLGSATGLAVGDAVNSPYVPKGSTIGALAGTTATLAIPPITLYGRVESAGALLVDLDSTDGVLGATVTVPSNNEQTALPSGTTVVAIVQAAIPATNLSPGVKGIVQLSAAPTQTPNVKVRAPFVFARTGNAILASGTDAAAVFTGAAISYTGTMQLERSFDGGATFVPCSLNLTGTLAQWDAGTPVQIKFSEPEKDVLYRLNCIAYTTGQISYRISQTGGAAESLMIGQLTGV